MHDQLMPEDINAVREELIIQKVMLDSMQGEDFDGDESEKEEIRKEIVRLKDILRRGRICPTAHLACLLDREETLTFFVLQRVLSKRPLRVKALLKH